MDAMDYMACLNTVERIGLRLCQGDALAPESVEIVRWHRSYRGKAGYDDEAVIAGLSYARDALVRYVPGDPLVAEADALLGSVRP